jgi:sugar lactone lactonase YvrE
MMGYTRCVLTRLALGVLVLSMAAAGAGAGEALAQHGMWDELAQWVVPRFIEKNDDFPSIISPLRKASCTIEVELTSAALEEPLTGRLRYAWEDLNDNGMLSEREFQVQVQDASGPLIEPYLNGLKRYLEDQTLLYFPFLFQINDIRAVKIPGGYRLRLRPASEGASSALLDYSTAYITLTDDFRATEMQAQNEHGVETVFRFKQRQVGDRWLSAGYLRRITTPTARAEEDRSEVYDTVDGVELLKEVVTDTFIATANGAARVQQRYTCKDWKIEKRARPMPPTGLRAEGIMPSVAPRELTSQDYRIAKTLSGHAGAVLTVAYAPDGRLIASGSMDKTIKFWDPATGNCVKTLEGLASPVNALAFTPDGKSLLSGSGPEEQSLRLWNVADGKGVKVLEGGPRVVFAVGCSPDGTRFVASGEGGAISVWDASSFQRLEPLAGHLLDVYALAYTPPNPLEKNAQALLLSGSADGTARLWKLAGTTWPGLVGENFGTLKGNRQVACVAASWNGERVAAAGTGKDILVWDTATGRPLQTLEGHLRWVECLAFIPVPGGTLLASGSRDRMVRVWDVEKGKCLQTLEDHESSVRTVAFAPDGNQIVSGSDDKTLKIWARTAPPKPPEPPAPAPAPPAPAPAPDAKK